MLTLAPRLEIVRVRLRSAIKLVYSAQVVEDADHYEAPRNQDVGRGPVPRRCPARDCGGPQVAALQWVRCAFAGDWRFFSLLCAGCRGRRPLRWSAVRFVAGATWFICFFLPYCCIHTAARQFLTFSTKRLLYSEKSIIILHNFN